MEKGEERKRKREKLWLPTKIFFFPFFSLQYQPRVKEHVDTHRRTIHHENLVCRNKFKPPAASVSTIEKKILQGEDDTGWQDLTRLYERG